MNDIICKSSFLPDCCIGRGKLSHIEFSVKRTQHDNIIFHIHIERLSEFGKKLHISKTIKKNTLDMDFPIVDHLYFY